jgi:hypothetical protein
MAKRGGLRGGGKGLAAVGQRPPKRSAKGGRGPANAVFAKIFAKAPVI